jgi:hypothetical protein
MGHFLQVFSPRDLINPLIRILVRIHKTIQYFLQLHGLIPFKDDESNVDPESSYALSRRVSGCPTTKFGVRIPLKTQALPATVDITPDFLTVYFGWTPRFTHLCVIGELQYIIERSIQHLLGGYLPLATCRHIHVGA